MQLIPLFLLTAISIAGFYLISETPYKNAGRVLIALCALSVVAYFVCLCYLWVAYTSDNALLYSAIVTVTGIIIAVFIAGFIWGIHKNKKFYLPLVAAYAVCLLVVAGDYIYKAYEDNVPVVVESENLLAEYAPYGENSKVAALEEACDLALSDNLPVMDGSTALYPVYSAFARAVYPKDVIDSDQQSKYLKCSKHASAYELLIAGETDIIFVPQPSEEQTQLAKDMGVELVCTPVVKDAFVFFVNKDNPIEDVSVQQLQDIYSGHITSWEQLGIDELGDIRAFQRNEGSVSQRALELFMAGKKIMNPPMEDIFSDTGLVISRAADYRNYNNAIGFSFRFYSTEMLKNNEIKLLSMNGIQPNLENIKSSTYPATAYLYAVTRSDMTENTKKLLDWITGSQGQKLVEMTGYAPVKRY